MVRINKLIVVIRDKPGFEEVVYIYEMINDNAKQYQTVIMDQFITRLDGRKKRISVKLVGLLMCVTGQ